MNELLQTLETNGYDGLNFYFDDEDGEVVVAGFTFKVPGEKLPGSSLGDLYDIIIMSDTRPNLPERFKAILISPVDYVKRMLGDGFVGILSKATTTSDSFMNDAFAAMTESAELIMKEENDVSEN